MVTRDDVAREAGTSSAVVSYVINNGPRHVSESTRQRVLLAVEKLSYRPNAFARSLRASSSTVLGLIVSDIANPYCAELASALEHSAVAAGYTLLLGNTTNSDERLARHLESFIEHRVKGIVFVGSSDGDESIPPVAAGVLAKGAPPLVFIDRSIRIVGAKVISIDNHGGAFAATTHLLEHRHPEVANFAGTTGSSAVRERTAGWADALSARGIDVGRQRRFGSSFDRYDAFAQAQAMFASSNHPRAIFSHSDEQSIGIIHAAAQAGLRIPEDIALVSFDDIKEASILTPGLTTIKQPLAELGRMAVDYLLDDDARATAEADDSSLLPVELVVRQSCGCG